MKIYWDTSAIVHVSHDPKKRHWLNGDQNYTRPHTLAELFSTLTSGRYQIRYSPDAAVRGMDEWLAHFIFVDLDKQDTLRALKSAGGLNVHGGHVHDFMHVTAANKVCADRLLTINMDDFVGLTKTALNPAKLEHLPGQPGPGDAVQGNEAPQG